MTNIELAVGLIWLLLFVIAAQRITSMVLSPVLLSYRYKLFSLRDDLRWLYIHSQHKEIEGVEFCEADFHVIESRINGAVGNLPILSWWFIGAYMQVPEFIQLINIEKYTRKRILQKYANTPVGEELKRIDEQVTDTLFKTFCLNSPIYVACHYAAFRWRSQDYLTWREQLRFQDFA